MHSTESRVAGNGPRGTALGVSTALVTDSGDL